MSRRLLPWVVVGLVVGGAVPPARAGGATIEIASLLADDSTPSATVRAWGARVERRTRGKVRVQVDFGGAAGDEATVVDKLRRGELQGAFLSDFGLGLAQPELHVFDLPFLVESVGDLRRVRSKVDASLRARLADRGLVALGWSEMGPVHLFSKVPLRTLDDLRARRVWVLPEDRVMQAWFAALGVTAVPLPVPQVRRALADGAVDAFCATPLIPLALGWDSEVHAMTSLVIARPVTALVVTRQAWDRLGRPARQVLLAESRALLADLGAQLTEGQAWAVTELTKAGLQIEPTPTALVDELRRAAAAMRPGLDGQLYSERFRAEVEGAVRAPN